MRNVPETIHCYKIPRLNWIFVLFSLLFVLSMVWMIWFDYIGYRKWKDYQREFQTIEAAKLRRDVQEAELKAEQAGVKKIEEEILAEEKLVAANKDKLKQAIAKADKERVIFENKDTEYKFRKADLDAQKYKHDVAFEHFKENPKDDQAKRRYLEAKGTLDAMKAEVDGLEREAQDLEKIHKAAQAEVERIVREKTRLEKEMKQLLTRKTLAERKLTVLTDRWIQGVVNAPFLEITEPTIKVKQIVLDNHRFNVNFAEVERVDRCISCHNGIAKRDPAPANGASPEKKTPTAKDIESGNFRFADLPQPHTAHPNPDLFVADGSKHPMDKFGCTPCHWGWDRGMDFSRSAHMPDEEKIVKVSVSSNGKTRIVEKSQKEAWVEKYHWHEMHHAEQKMRPLSFTESSCLKCHTGQTTIEHADNLNHGIRLIEQAGCYNCHKMRPLETFVTHIVKEGQDVPAVARLLSSDVEAIREANSLKTDELKVGMELTVPVRALTKTGPNLVKVSSKLDKDWVRRWLAEPKRFRPNTFMPQFWHLENTYQRLTNITDHITYRGVTGDQFRMADRDEVEIEAITELLFALSDAPKYPAPPVQGNADSGKKLVENLGCLACHVVNERLEPETTYSDGTPVDDAKFPLLRIDAKLPTLDIAQYKRSRSQGPMLFGSGSKMDANWIYAWLKDPKQYHPRTKMPNLRLTDQEAADVASYLVTLKNDDFDKRPLKDMSDTVFRRLRDDMLREYLQGEYSMDEAAKMVESGNLDAKTAEFFRRIKYSDVNDLLNRWTDAVNALSRLPADPSDAERKALRVRIERLAEQMRDLARQRPPVAELLHTWAGQLAELAMKAATWNSIEEKDRKQALDAAYEAPHAGQKAFGDFAQAQAAALDLELKKKLYLGDKLVGRYGCYSCHNMTGYETAKPIGTEMSEWGTKLTSTLDFGYLEGKIDHSNYAYVQQKVKAPRSFDKTEVKKPQEWFKMPQYNFNAEQRKAIAIAVMGMTDEKVLPQARRNLTENEWQIENGRWMVKELNCVGCHIVEKKGGALLATLDPAQKQMWPPNLSGTGTKIKPTWLYHFLKEPGDYKFRYWLNARMPSFGFTDEQVNSLTRYFALLDSQAFPFEAGTLTDTYHPPKESVATGEEIFVKFQCYKCHVVRPAEQAARASNIGPDLKQTKVRMRPSGLVPWLRDPASITPGVNMPANWPTEADAQNPLPNVLDGSTEKQIKAMADYLLTYDGSIEAKFPPPKEEPAPAGGDGGKSDYE
jgi:cytochrome c2